MNNSEFGSRKDRLSKRKKNNQQILFFIGLGVLFLAILLFLILNGNKSSVNQADENNDNTNNIIEKNEKQEEEKEPDKQAEPDKQPIDDENVQKKFEKVITEEVSTADDNVKEALVGDWPPIGTNQASPKSITDYTDGSSDRLEIKQAVSLVTGIPMDNMTELWVGNDGDPLRVVTTVATKGKQDYHRVYLSWVDNEGWQVTRIEKLKKYEQS